MFGLKQDTEIFPKQTQLTKDSETGHYTRQFTNLPYWQERKALNVDGTTFNLTIYEGDCKPGYQRKHLGITEENTKSMEGVDEELDGPPC